MEVRLVWLRLCQDPPVASCEVSCSTPGRAQHIVKERVQWGGCAALLALELLVLLISGRMLA